jgi:hypothetical protein
MFTVSTRLSQWTAHKVSSSAATALEASSAYHMAPLHPAWIAAARRFQHSTVSVAVHQQAPPLQRWKQNLSRIYARRIIEIAIASAATQRLLTDMEKVIDRPSDWKNWERKDWTDELLQSIGSTPLQRLWSATSRLMCLATLAAPLSVLMPLSYVSDRAHRWSWEYALWGIEQAGPTYIKLVQWVRIIRSVM